MIKQFLAGVAATIVLDLLWMGLVVTNVFTPGIAQLLRTKADGNLDPIWWSAGVIYLLIPVGVLFFVTPQVPAEAWAKNSGLLGFVFGLIVYGIYEFTNFALMKDWPISLVIADTIWGGVLCGLVAVVISAVDNTRQ